MSSVMQTDPVEVHEAHEAQVTSPVGGRLESRLESALAADGHALLAKLEKQGGKP